MNASKDIAEQTLAQEPSVATTVDAFHRGRFHLVQPKGKGHRAGLDAMLLAALVPAGTKGRLADFGAGAGAVGIAAVSRNPNLKAVLVERSATMAECARRSVELPQNAQFADRLEVLEADVTLRGALRQAVGLTDVSFDHVIMNPPFNSPFDRVTPDVLRAVAHAMPEAMFEDWIRAACAVCKPDGQLSLIARPQSLADVMRACEGRFGAVQVTPVHPRTGADAIRILVTGIKGSRAGLSLRPALVVHEGDDRAFSTSVDELINGRGFLPRD